MAKRPLRRNGVGLGMDKLLNGPYAALETKVGVLETDIAGVSNRLDNLDAKFDKVMAGFASEFRTAIGTLSTQLSEKNKTPWGVLISGAGVVLTFVALLGHQTLSPITSDLERVSREVVPRKEYEARHAFLNEKVSELKMDLSLLRQREYDGRTREIEFLRQENRLLKSGGHP